MLVENKTVNNNNITQVSFNSINEYVEWTKGKPNLLGKVDSETGSYNFTKTNNYDEALSLLLNGWDEGAKDLTKQLNTRKMDIGLDKSLHRFLSVAGYQACVPRYLQGQPNNMFSQKMEVKKQKVITINKEICYACNVKSQTIMEESIKALQVVKKLEQSGFRCNLNIIMGFKNSFGRNDRIYLLKIKIKSSTEKLNISKMAFPLVHPSMLRRIIFRFLEIYPGVPEKFKNGYGYPITHTLLQQLEKDLGKDINKEFFIPAQMGNFNAEELNSLEDLHKFCTF